MMKKLLGTVQVLDPVPVKHAPVWMGLWDAVWRSALRLIALFPSRHHPLVVPDVMSVCQQLITIAIFVDCMTMTLFE